MVLQQPLGHIAVEYVSDGVLIDECGKFGHPWIREAVISHETNHHGVAEIAPILFKFQDGIESTEQVLRVLEQVQCRFGVQAEARALLKFDKIYRFLPIVVCGTEYRHTGAPGVRYHPFVDARGKGPIWAFCQDKDGWGPGDWILGVKVQKTQPTLHRAQASVPANRVRELEQRGAQQKSPSKEKELVSV